MEALKRSLGFSTAASDGLGDDPRTGLASRPVRQDVEEEREEKNSTKVVLRQLELIVCLHETALFR
jgi:hypothetical protein